MRTAGRAAILLTVLCLGIAFGQARAAAAQDSAVKMPTDLLVRNSSNVNVDRLHLRWRHSMRDEVGELTPFEGFLLMRSVDGGPFERREVLAPTAHYFVDELADLKEARAAGVPIDNTGRRYLYRLDVQVDEETVLEGPLSGELVFQPSGLTTFQRATVAVFDWSRFWFLIIVVVLCGSVLIFILMAKRGIDLKVRKIAGLEAVDEAVGRATEMGRSVLFIPGIQDMNDIQTVAGITILARVARTAAEYDAKVEVPTARSLVMTTARETVQAAYLSAGRPDAYNQDQIYYVTDEQFGYVAYLSGMMVREKPAACFYMGSFFAESLILAETGNGIGAIQVAGTAQPAQLPFFVAACDYTLIGEEFFAASAYLSGEPDQLGSLKGQDVGKLIVGIFIIIGSAMATLAVITESYPLLDFVHYLRDTVLK